MFFGKKNDQDVQTQLKKIADHIGFLEKKIDTLLDQNRGRGGHNPQRHDGGRRDHNRPQHQGFRPGGGQPQGQPQAGFPGGAPGQGQPNGQPHREGGRRRRRGGRGRGGDRHPGGGQQPSQPYEGTGPRPFYAGSEPGPLRPEREDILPLDPTDPQARENEN